MIGIRPSRHHAVAARFAIILPSLICISTTARQALNGQLPVDGSDSIPSSVIDSINAMAVDFMAGGGGEQIPGMVLVIATRRGIQLAEGYGWANLERKIPMTAQTGLRVGSVSKTVTAAAVMQLVERRHMHLEAPVSEYISDLDLVDEYGRASTVVELLTHRGGYDDTVVLSHVQTPAEWQPLGAYLRATLAPRALPPGMVMSYSSWGHALLGYAIETVTGSPYESVIAQSIFAPLGMKWSTFEQPLPAHIEENLATGYGFADGKFQVVPHDLVRLSPGVALVTNGEDMGRFMQTLLGGGRVGDVQVLQPETTDLLLRRQVADHPRLRGRSLGFSELTLSGRRLVYHDGNGIGFSNRIALVPNRGIGLFASINHRSLARNANSTSASIMMKQFATRTLELLVPEDNVEEPSRVEVSGTARNAARFEGQYRLASTARRDFFRIAGLVNYVDVAANDDGTLRIGSSTWVSVEPRVYQHQTIPSALVAFLENETGNVAFLTYGGTASYRRLGWFETTQFQKSVGAVMLLLFFSIAVTRPRAQPGRWIVWALSILNLIFIGAFGVTMMRSDFLTFFKTVPNALKLILYLPWVSALLTLFLPVVGWRTLRKREVQWGWRAHYIGVTLAAATFV